MFVCLGTLLRASKKKKLEALLISNRNSVCNMKDVKMRHTNVAKIGASNGGGVMLPPLQKVRTLEILSISSSFHQQYIADEFYANSLKLWKLAVVEGWRTVISFICSQTVAAIIVYEEARSMSQRHKRTLAKNYCCFTTAI